MSDTPPPGNESDSDAPSDTRCLVRAQGAKLKISAMVTSKEYERFMRSYGNILKVSLDALKKKEKVKKDKPKGEKGQSKAS